MEGYKKLLAIAKDFTMENYRRNFRVYNDSKYERTDKIWKIVNGERMREESEQASTKEELDQLMAVGKDYLSLTKTRTDYRGEFMGYRGVISLDEVTFFPDESRYFIELEIDVPEEKSNAIRSEIKEYLLTTFQLSDRPEGIGMMRLIMSKIEK